MFLLIVLQQNVANILVKRKVREAVEIDLFSLQVLFSQFIPRDALKVIFLLSF